MPQLKDVIAVARSKNASPFELTLDIFVRNTEDYLRLKENGLPSREAIAKAYNIPVGHVKDIFYFDQANAIKINLPRRHSSGSFGDSDVYGAQQHANLLGIQI